MDFNNKYDAAVVGAGASGMVSAIVAARNGARVVLIEKNPRVGKKIALTGNGRCNISNKNINPERYHGDVDFAFDVFKNVSRETIENFFEQIGIVFTADNDDRLYPKSFQATSVVDALRFACDREGVTTLTDCVCGRIEQNNGIFKLFCKQGDTSTVINATKLVVAAGGCACSKSGTDGYGVRLLKAFGHSASPCRPAIVQLKTDRNFVRSVKGVKIDANVWAALKNGCKKSEYGEVLFTEYGLSGPPIMQFGRFSDELKDNLIHLDLLPDIDIGRLKELLGARTADMPELPLKSVFMGLLQSRLGEMIVKSVFPDRLNCELGGVTHPDINKIAERVKDFAIEVVGNTGFDNAQVTAGGIKCEEFKPETLESRIVKGLFVCGEVLDVDGDCGGFNLHWAWASGILCGNGVANQENK